MIRKFFKKNKSAAPKQKSGAPNQKEDASTVSVSQADEPVEQFNEQLDEQSDEQQQQDDDDASSAQKKNPRARHKKKATASNSTEKKHHQPQMPWDISQFQVPELEGKMRFQDLDLPVEILHAIADLGFQYCSPIQSMALPQAMDGYDVVGKAQTGTGKTAAFLITILTDLLENPVAEERFLGEPRALIIAPTRELVMQIAKDAEQLSKYTDIEVLTLVGGMDYVKQQRQLQNKLVDIVVATPGRLMDFESRGDIHLDQVEVLVIDEADRMLDMGFIPQVRRIVRCAPRKTHRQTLLFSATFTPAVIELTEQWTHDPKIIEIAPDQVAAQNVEQVVYLVSGVDKFKLLFNVIQQDGCESILVFANRRDETRKLQEKLSRYGIRCGLLSGEVAQNKRVRTLEDFREGKFQVLVATDVAGRGIHIDGISHVVNFTLPEDPEDYVHRIGRTGRAGAMGTSVSFACEDDSFLLPAIEKLLGEKLPCKQPGEELLATLPAPQNFRPKTTPHKNDYPKKRR